MYCWCCAAYINHYRTNYPHIDWWSISLWKLQRHNFSSYNKDRVSLNSQRTYWKRSESSLNSEWLSAWCNMEVLPNLSGNNNLGAFKFSIYVSWKWLRKTNAVSLNLKRGHFFKMSGFIKRRLKGESGGSWSSKVIYNYSNINCWNIYHRLGNVQTSIREWEHVKHLPLEVKHYKYDTMNHALHLILCKLWLFRHYHNHSTHLLTFHFTQNLLGS